MPAKRLQPATGAGTYRHVYNKGVENRVIFADEADYQTFLGFLEEYLSPRISTEEAKKDFSINGRFFKGVPHQPKNYFGKIELVAYSLEPNHFHLLTHETKPQSLQAFMRSLSTRYSIYFNKKYHHTGPLFEGPYKSATIENEKAISLLAHHFHKHSQHSSYPQYLGQTGTPKLSSKVIQSVITGEENYQDFVENHGLNNIEKALLREIAIEDVNDHLVRRNLAGTAPKHSFRIPELIGAGAIFVLLLGLGIRNINMSNHSPAALGTKTSQPSPSISPSPTPDVKAKVINY